MAAILDNQALSGSMRGDSAFHFYALVEKGPGTELHETADWHIWSSEEVMRRLLQYFQAIQI